MFKSVFLLLVLCLPAFPQESQEDFVTVPKKYVSSEGLSHAQNNDVGKWVGIGREIGIATKEGLNSVVDVSERFSGTNVGRFVMFMVAWKILAQDIIRIALGVPLLIAGCFLWWKSLSKFFFEEHKSEQGQEDKRGYRFRLDGDGKLACGVTHAVAALLLLILFCFIIFQ